VVTGVEEKAGWAFDLTKDNNITTILTAIDRRIRKNDLINSWFV
jgi:hypothetical protein